MLYRIDSNNDLHLMYCSFVLKTSNEMCVCSVDGEVCFSIVNRKKTTKASHTFGQTQHVYKCEMHRLHLCFFLD